MYILYIYIYIYIYTYIYIYIQVQNIKLENDTAKKIFKKQPFEMKP